MQVQFQGLDHALDAQRKDRELKDARNAAMEQIYSKNKRETRGSRERNRDSQ